MALLRYSLLRVLVFAVVAALLWLIGMRGLWWLLVSVFGSGLVSLFVLNKSRDELSVALVDRTSRIKTRLAERTVAEDAWDEQRRAGQKPEDSG